MTYSEIYKNIFWKYIIDYEKITKNNLTIVIASAKECEAQIYIVWQIWDLCPQHCNISLMMVVNSKGLV
jgi:hypothetical protein